LLSDDRTIVDVLTLEDFKVTLEARLDEANAVRTALIDGMGRVAPKLGTFQDATYVQERYLTLYDQHLDRVTGVIRALEATRDAITTIIENYRTNEARLVANANDIADALGAISGGHGELTDAG
jgi:hypothetical protein